MCGSFFLSNKAVILANEFNGGAVGYAEHNAAVGNELRAEFAHLVIVADLCNGNADGLKHKFRASCKENGILEILLACSEVFCK